MAMLCVRPECRRQGIGTALVRHVESLCKTDKLFTSTNESNRPMRALLAKLQYVCSGVIHNLDEGDPEIVYFKRVSR
jgi:ribosomal protein S18 acetylase RimI-like enzyme